MLLGIVERVCGVVLPGGEGSRAGAAASGGSDLAHARPIRRAAEVIAGAAVALTAEAAVVRRRRPAAHHSRERKPWATAGAARSAARACCGACACGPLAVHRLDTRGLQRTLQQRTALAVALRVAAVPAVRGRG